MEIEDGDASELAAALRGDLIRPGDAGYEEARAIWNGMIDRRPALIARCAGASDVSAAVRFAAERGLPLSVRGGGHGVAGLALAAGELVVDLTGMRDVEVDPKPRPRALTAAARSVTWMRRPRSTGWRRRSAWSRGPGSRG